MQAYLLTNNNGSYTFRAGAGPSIQLQDNQVKQLLAAGQQQRAVFETFIEAERAYLEAGQNGRDSEGLAALKETMDTAYQDFLKASEKAMVVYDRVARQLGLAGESASGAFAASPNSSQRKTTSVENQASSLLKRNPSMSNAVKRKSDSVSISGEGKLAQLLETMKAQKEAIIEQKEAMVERAIQADIDLTDIQEPLASLDERMDVIDEQMRELMAQLNQNQAEKLAGYNRQQKTHQSSVDEMDEGQETARLTRLSTQISQRDVMLHAQNRMEGESRTKQAGVKNSLLRNDLHLSQRKADAAMAKINGDGGISREELKSILNERRHLSRQMREIARQTHRTTQDMLQLGEQLSGAKTTEKASTAFSASALAEHIGEG